MNKYLRTCLTFEFSALIFLNCILVGSTNNLDSSVEVRAVFINCETFVRPDSPDGPNQRFERQELFKHNALRSCNKKLALTVKIASPVDVEEEFDLRPDSRCDEYIPIDHVFEGSDRKRVRLLNPYILRLRREPPKQAYKLHRIDVPKSREARDVDYGEADAASILGGSPAFTLDHEDPSRRSYSVRIGRLQELIKSTPDQPEKEPNVPQDCGLRLFNQPNEKVRRSQDINTQKVVLYDNNMTKDKRDICFKNSTYRRAKRQKEFRMTVNNDIGEDVTPMYLKEHDFGSNPSREKTTPLHSKKTDKSKHKNSQQRRHNTNKGIRFKENPPKTSEYGTANDKILPTEKDFALYEIGNPDLFYNIKVQLFEKMSTSDGKTVWNDLTKGTEASVSSVNPEWKGTDVNVRYRPVEWIAREEFTLPKTKLCLLEPLQNENLTVEDELLSKPSSENYIVVPLEDVIYLTDKINKKRDGNVSDKAANDNYVPNKAPRRVEVRASRAIFGTQEDKLDVARMGSDRFLMLPHKRPHHSQIDVEVRADDNQLVRIGSSARLATVVSDNTRKTRTTIHFQATNTGLASARFKALIRDCGPELLARIHEKGEEDISTEPILLPPHHTRRLKLEVPVGLSSGDVAHCNVALLNDDDEAVAVRDVSIRKGDRCFCVWHCECVCLGEDPKLICREMSQPQQVAAGLPARGRMRYSRSICYSDNIALDFFTVFIAVIIFLLLLGFIKGVVGLFSIPAGQVGWALLLQPPRVLEEYYEPCLRSRKVVYKEGWPVHPDSKERTVRILSPVMGFLLNLIFFLAIPCLALLNACNSMCAKMTCGMRTKTTSVYSAHDLQSESLELIVRRKKRRLSDWMTPFAEQLAADVLGRALHSSGKAVPRNRRREMQPLLHERKIPRSHCGGDCGASIADSELEDTEYVLMQMQKSRESLAKSQKKLNDSIHSSERKSIAALVNKNKK